MRLIVAHDGRFDRTPDGAVWSSYMPTSIWGPYLAAFEEIACIARVRETNQVPDAWHRVDGARVRFITVPYYLGMKGYLRHAWAVRRTARQSLGESDAVVLYASSQVAAQLLPVLVKRRQPFGLQVIGDPYEALGPGAVKHPLRPLLRWWFTRRQRQQCRQASCITYVTRESLQRRYPAGRQAWATSCSDVELQDSAYVSRPRTGPPSSPVRLLIVGMLEQPYKATDVLIDAFGMCARNGLDLRLTVVGDGRFRPMLEERSRELGLSERIRFLGQLSSGAAVREQLDAADLFVLPSRTEGLPRAMIEAMARGLPCIGTAVGGIPELLDPENLVPPEDAEALAAKINEIVLTPERMAQMSAQNLNRAAEYRQETLWNRRVEFYLRLREQTEEWLRKQK